MTKIPLRLALLASVLALPLSAAAQATPAPQDKDSSSFDVSDAAPAAAQTTSEIPAATRGEITIGAADVSNSSDVFGRYNGMYRSGVGEVGGWNIQQRAPWDSDKTNFFSFTGDRVDVFPRETLPEADIAVKFGSQGHWWLSGEYSAMTYTASDHFTTILQPDGALSPAYLAAITAAGAFVTNSTTPNIGANTYYGTTYKASASTGIASSSGNHLALYGPANELTEYVGTRRDKEAVQGGLDIGNWVITAGLSHEHKQGSLEQAMTTAGSNAGFISFAMPIDYDTGIYTLSAAYNTRKFQAAFSYELSNFVDNNSQGFAFQGWNFTNVKDPVTHLYNAYEISGDYSLPPSNQAHTFTAQLGYNATSTTRLNATLVYGLQFQNDQFPAATGNAYTLNVNNVATHNTIGAAPAPLGLNPDSLNAFVETWFGSASMTSRPTSKVDVRAAYTIDVRDPHTSPLWIYGDPTDAVDNAANIKYREAVPESWTKQKLAVSAGYHLMPDTTLTAGYTFRDDRRGNAITHHTQDNEESVKLQTDFHEVITGSVTYLHADRNASAPDYSLWLVQISSDCGATLALLGCQQVPFYEAARTEDAVTGMLTAAFSPKASFSVYAKYNTDDYHLPNATYNGAVNPSVGINHDSNLQIAPDLSYQAGENNVIHVFYTYYQTYRAMRALNNQSDPTGGNYYSEATTYEIQTAGVSISRQATPKLKVGADYIYSYGNVGFNQSGTWTITEAGQTYGGDPYLNTKSNEHQVKLHASYAYSKRLSLYLSYRYDSLDTTDWALIGASAGQVLTGDIPPKYNVHTIMGAATFRF